MASERPAALTTRAGEPARDLWMLDQALVHLNHGSFGAVPVAAVREQDRLRAQMEAAPVRWFTTLGPRIVAAREAVAAFLGVPPHRTGLVANAGAGMTTALSALVPAAVARGRDTIVLTDHCYGAVAYAAQLAARRWGARVEVVPLPLTASTEEVTARLHDGLHERVGVLVLDQVTSATARHLPLGPSLTRARELGAYTVVDGAHTPGLLPSPTQGLDADVWIGNLHKFACAPRGTAAIVAGPEVGDLLYPVIDSWGTPDPFPSRFDMQGTIDATPWLAAPTALTHLAEALGWDRIREHARAQVDYAEQMIGRALAAAFGGEARVSQPSPVTAMRLLALPEGLAGTHAQADALRLPLHERAGIEAAFTFFDGRAYLRLSAHAYTTAEDAEAFVERGVPVLAALLRERRTDVTPSSPFAL